MIVFLHLERTAGSTVHSWFYPGVRPDFRGCYFVVSDDTALATVKEELHSRHRPLFYLGGHFSLAAIDHFDLAADPETLLFSMTRDPAERALSLYALVRRSPNWVPQISLAVLERGFEYFYEYCRDRDWFFSNAHCIRICGTPSAEQAFAVVSSRFTLLGASEAFDLVAERLKVAVSEWVPNFKPSVMRLNAALDLPTNYEVRNAMSTSLREKIYEENSEDLALHLGVIREGGCIMPHVTGGRHRC